MHAAKRVEKRDNNLMRSGNREAAGRGGTKGRPDPAQARNTVSSLARSPQRYLGNSHVQVQNSGPRVQRKCACGGTCAHCAAKDDEHPRLQAQLTIGPADDVYEREADRVAAQIMTMPDTSGEVEQGTHPRFSIQRITPSGDGGLEPPPDLTLNPSGGRALASSTRQYMEPRFGVDFGHVRLHTGEDAHQKATQIQARAFTYGHHVWLGKGEQEQNRGLMAHELTHVVQQGAAGPTPDPAEQYEPTGQGPTIQRDVRPQQRCPDGIKTVSVDMVSLRGSNRNPLDDLAHANAVFRPCCVQFTLGQGMSVDPTLSDTWLGGDTVLSRSPACGSAHAEETAMFDGAVARFGLSSRFRVFYVESITPGARAYSMPPYCATGAAASLLNMTVVTNNAIPRSLAHEFGHILLNSGSHTGIDNPADTGNLMVPSNTATGDNLDASQCATIFGNS